MPDCGNQGKQNGIGLGIKMGIGQKHWTFKLRDAECKTGPAPMHSKEESTMRLLSVFLIALLLLICSFSISAQSPWATLKEPPTGPAPAGDVISAGHLGREIGNVELMIHFYHDLLGLRLLGARNQPRPFGSKLTNPALLEFVQLGQGVPNPMDARNRAVILPIPGTAPKGGNDMTVEAIEIKNIASQPYQPSMRDPGSSRLILFVRELDKTLAVLKDELVPVITPGGKPVDIPSHPGLNGKMRAVFVRDPDGYPVGLMDITPPPPTTAPAESNILGARVIMVVENLETTCRWFQNLVGPDLQFWVSPSFVTDKAFEDLTGAPGKFRMAQALIPGSPVVMEFIQYENPAKNIVRPHIQDPGTAHILFMAKDDDVIMQRVQAAKIQTLSATGGPVFIGPVTRSFFVPNPDGFWAEFMDHNAKIRP
jgi:catechol 2,3-dioxygenase-like lactoylglutathione lyase family enzyme